MTEKVLIFDASSLISIAMNGLLHELKELKKIFPGKFIIPKEVKQEAIEKPLKINDEEISKETTNMLNIANSTFLKNGKKEIHLIDLGETACLVLSRILTNKKIPNLLVIDERTTRMLSEKPQNLKKLLQKKLHVRVDIKKENLKQFKGFKIVRSCELIY